MKLNKGSAEIITRLRNFLTREFEQSYYIEFDEKETEAKGLKWFKVVFE